MSLTRTWLKFFILFLSSFFPVQAKFCAYVSTILRLILLVSGALRINCSIDHRFRFKFQENLGKIGHKTEAFVRGGSGWASTPLLPLKNIFYHSYAFYSSSCVQRRSQNSIPTPFDPDCDIFYKSRPDNL
jgi:hypothetical protein